MQSNEQGFSIIELMIAIAILAFLGQQYANHSTQIEKNAMSLAAKKDAREQLLTGLNQIRKNMKSRAPGTALEVEPHRLVFQQEAADGSLAKITVSSLCRSSSLGSIDLVAIAPKDASCYQSLGCSGLPYIEILSESVGKPSKIIQYPATAAMEQQLKKQTGIAGLALCFQKTSDTLNIQAIQLVHTHNRQANTQVTVEGMNNQIPVDQRNSISFIR